MKSDQQMLLTWPLVTAGIVTGVGAFVAHWLMRDRRYATPIPRYIVGVLLALIPWGCALVIEETSITTAIVGAFYSFLCGAIGTWIGYETDPQAAPVTTADVERIVAAIEGEHGPDDRHS
jgi:hypothetical protein